MHGLTKYKIYRHMLGREIEDLSEKLEESGNATAAAMEVGGEDGHAQGRCYKGWHSAGLLD